MKTPKSQYERVLEELQKLYDSLPSVDCKGLCWTSCGPIDMSNAERRRITELGVNIPVFTEAAAQRWAANETTDLCPAFSLGGRDGVSAGCTVYEARPMICRIWGVTATMECEYGCEKTGTLSTLECFQLLAKADVIGGSAHGIRDGDASMFERVLANPEAAEAIEAYLAGDQSRREEALKLMELTALEQRGDQRARRTP